MTKPTLIAAAVAALATTAHAAPPRPQAPTPRPLLRPVASPSVPVATPFTNREGRPVCGNIANKGKKLRECIDAVGRNFQEQRRDSAAGPTWITLERNCTIADAQVKLTPATGRAEVVRAGKVSTTAFATSTDPAVIACRAGLS
jgi:hypothetical protein